MLLLLFLLTTTAFGVSLILLIRRRTFPLFLLASIGWLIGSMLTALIVFVSTYFIPLSSKMVYCVMLMHAVFASLIAVTLFLQHRSDYRSLFSVFIERSPWALCSMLFCGAFSLYCNYQFYRPWPNYIPYTARAEIEVEHSAVASFINGINRKRVHFTVLSDPMAMNSTLKMSPLPVTLMACMAQLTTNFVDIGVTVSFINSICAGLALYTLVSSYTSYSFVCIVAILLNGGWAFVRYLYTPNDGVDLVHDVDRGFNVPFYQIFYTFFVASRTASFVFPMAVFFLAFTTVQKMTTDHLKMYIIAGIFIGLCPSFMTTCCLLILSSCFIHSLFFTLPFAVVLIWKAQYCSFTQEPIWREYQMNGIFFSQLLSWIDAFGPFSIMLFIFPFAIRDSIFFHRFLVTLCPMIFISFFRNGGYYFDNALAASSTVFPIVVCACFHASERLISKMNKQIKGVFQSICVLIIITSIFGGIFSANKQLSRCVTGITPNDSSVGTWIVRHVPANETIFMIQMPMNPVSFSAGRRVLSGMPQDLWARGENYARATNILRRIDTFQGAPNLMRAINLTYLLENKEVPLVSKNKEFMKQYAVMEMNEKWSLLKLI